MVKYLTLVVEILLISLIKLSFGVVLLKYEYPYYVLKLY